MTTKKKRKTAMDAIDKYLQQKRYSRGKKYEKQEKPTRKTAQVTVSKISSGFYSTPTRSNEGDRKSVRTSKVPKKKTESKAVDKKKLTKNDTGKRSTNNVKSLPMDVKKSSVRVAVRTSKTKRKTAKISPSTRTQSTNRKSLVVSPKQLRSRKGKNVGIEVSKEVAPEGATIQQDLPDSIKKVRVTRRDLSDQEKNNNKNISKSKGKDVKESKKKVTKTAKSIRNKKSKSEEKVLEDSIAVDSKVTNNTYLVPKSTCDSHQENQVTDTICAPIIVTNNIADKGKKTFENADSCLPKKKRKIVIDDQPVRVNSSGPVHESTCSYNDIAPSLQGENIDTEIQEEVTPITKKYQPYMERLKLLSSDDIQKYIRDNQQYYVNYKNDIESKSRNVESLPGKKRKKYDEMRDSFKCNPFNSDQQLAMYYTLREIFEVPKTHFVECRDLFTILLPEISCQLFAETFHIKVSFAPRLIKKLYPNPVCPV